MREGPRESLGESPPKSGTAAARDEAGELQELTGRLEHLGRLIEQAKGQVTAYLLSRDSDGGAAEALDKKLDVLVEKLSQFGEATGSRALDQKLDALYGKLDLLAKAGGRAAAAGEAPAAGVSEAALKNLLRPVAEKLDHLEKSGFRPVAEKIEHLDAKLKTLADRSAAVEALKEAFVPTLVKVRDGLSEQHAAIHAGVGQVQQQFSVLPQYFDALRQQLAAAQQRVDAGLKEIMGILRPPEPQPSAAPVVSGDWQQAVLGEELAANPALDFQRQKLFSGVLSSEPAACSLAGQLLVFRSSPAEKMPALLKEIGEAYYRWQPRTTSKPTEMEKALIAWLQKTCDAAGISNTIELVHPGERFDSTRHNASERGVEITQVLGWIVLRDNGKVYTKATVAVK